MTLRLNNLPVEKVIIVSWGLLCFVSLWCRAAGKEKEQSCLKTRPRKELKVIRPLVEAQHLDKLFYHLVTPEPVLLSTKQPGTKPQAVGIHFPSLVLFLNLFS